MWFSIRLYLVCALLTTVSAGNMLKREKKKKIRSVGQFLTLPTSHHRLSEAFKSVCAKWLQRFHSGAN